MLWRRRLAVSKQVGMYALMKGTRRSHRPFPEKRLYREYADHGWCLFRLSLSIVESAALPDKVQPLGT